MIMRRGGGPGGGSGERELQSVAAMRGEKGGGERGGLLKRVRRSFEQEKEKEDFMTGTLWNWIMILYTHINQQTANRWGGGGREM